MLLRQRCCQNREDKKKKNDNSGNGFAEIGERKEKIKDCNCGYIVAKIEKIKKKEKKKGNSDNVLLK